MSMVPRSSADRNAGFLAGDSFGPSPASGRTRTHVDSLAPPHTEVATVREFMSRLGELRLALGLSYSELGARAGKGFGKSTANRVLNDLDVLISAKHLKLYLRACRLAPEDQERWLRAWDLVQEYTLKDNVIQLPGGLRHDAPTPAGPVPPVHDGDAAAPPPDEDAPDESGTSTGWAATAEPHPVGDPARRPGMAVVRAALAFSTLLATSTAAVIAMWLVHLPPELIIAVFGLVVVCMASWVAVYRVAILTAADADREPPEPWPAYGGGGAYPGSHPGHRADRRRRRRPRALLVAHPWDIVGEPPRASTPVIGSE